MIRFLQALGTVSLCALAWTSTALAAAGERGATLTFTRTDLFLLAGGGSVIVLIGFAFRQLLRERQRSAQPGRGGRPILHAESASVDERKAMSDA